MSNLDVIGATDAAKLLGVARSTIAARVQSGTLTPTARVGKRGTFVFDRAEIERLAAEGARNE